MPRVAVMAVGPMAVIKRLNGPSVPRRLNQALTTGPEIRWRNLQGPPFLYTAANWGAVSWYLEVDMRDTSGVALARLYDVTDAAAVANSVITDNSVDDYEYVRSRSAAMTLVDGHEYRVQFGVQDGGQGGALGAKLVAV